MSTTTHFNVLEHRVPCQHIRQYPRATSHSEEDELFLAVKQYVPRSTSPKHGTGITIVGCHANGFPKELYEPLWDALFEHTQKSTKTHILNIFIADVANQGQSGVWNADKLGNEPSWYDDARDYLGMVNYFRKDMKQPIVAFGHSMGGSILLNVALMHARLFTTMINFEATVFRSPRQFTSLGAYPIIFRKDQWPSREAVARSFSKHPIYKTWDPAVLQLFLQYGLRDLPTQLYPNVVPSDSSVPVTLTTSKHQEVSSYTRAGFPSDRDTPLSAFSPTTSSHPDIGPKEWRHPKEPFYRPETTLIFAQLPYLRPSCLWLYGAETTFMVGQKARDERANALGSGIGGSGGIAAGRVESREVSGGGHFLPFEAPRKLAMEVVGPWFDKEVELWEKNRQEERRAWDGVNPAKRSQVSEDFLHWMKTHNDPRKVTRAMRLKL